MDVYMSEEFKMKRRMEKKEREMRRKPKSSNDESDGQYTKAKRWTVWMAGYKQERGVDSPWDDDNLFNCLSA